MIKIYEEFTDDFKRKMNAIEEIDKLYDKITSLFKKLTYIDITYLSNKGSNHDIVISFYIPSYDKKNIICEMILSLSDNIISGDYDVKISINFKIVKIDNKYLKNLDELDSFIHFLAFVFDPYYKHSYFDEFHYSVKIKDISKIISRINIYEYNIWRDISKYNL